LNAQQIRQLLDKRGFKSDPGLKPPRPGHGFKAGPEVAAPSHTIWVKRLGAVWWGTVRLPDDCEKLTALARETSECFYAFSGPTPSTLPFPRVADRLIWWTKVTAADVDIFVPMERYLPCVFDYQQEITDMHPGSWRERLSSIGKTCSWREIRPKWRPRMTRTSAMCCFWTMSSAWPPNRSSSTEVVLSR
jgi:hypothetical protein